MKVSHELVDNLTAKISIDFVQDDFQEEVKKELNNYRRTASIKGFRPGKVPFGMIQKMYGESVTANVVSNLLGEALDKYIADNKFKYLGQPIPDTEKQKVVDFAKDTEFSFYYELGLKPEFDIEIDDKIKLTSYEIEHSEEDVNKYLMDMRRRFGTPSNPEKAEDGDIVYGKIEELDADGKLNPEGVSIDAPIGIDYIQLKGVKDSFKKLTKGSTTTFNPRRAFKNDVELSSLLKIGLNEAKEYKHDVQFTLEEVRHFEPAEINEELFAKVYENDHISSEEELRARIQRDIVDTYANEGKNHFMNQMVDLLVKKTDLPLPDAFLKRWILESNAREEQDKKISPEELEAQYVNYRDTLRWQLVEEKIMEKYGLTLTNDEIKAKVAELLGMQFGGGDTEDETQKRIVEQVTESVMQNKEEVQRVADQIMEQKLMDLFNEKAKITNKKISYDDFVKMVQEEVAAKSEQK